MRRICQFYLVFFLLFAFQCVFAHGTLEAPISRVYTCFKENPENPKSAACKAAVAAGGTQQFYDWNGVNQGAANDRHQEIIPDGKLCSAGRDLFKGLDLARSDWPSTPIAPGSDGKMDFVWLASAPHATKYFKLYVTKSTYDLNQPLKWSDLEPTPFCTITSVTLANGRYRLRCPVPEGTGKRIVYLIWQRSDSPEAFYACSDVTLSGGGNPPPPITWNVLGDFTANAELIANTKVNVRIMPHDGSGDTTFNISVPAANTAVEEWPYYVAQQVNAQSTFVHIGQLNPATGEVVPVRSATQNKVYLQNADVAQYHFAMDFILPNEQIDFIYPDGINSYVAGTIVMGFDQRRYQCKPWPASPWCKQSPLYYEPGKGIAWQQAWNVL